MNVEAEAFANEVETSLLELTQVVMQPAFQHLIAELRGSPKPLRHKFVQQIVIDPTEITKRGIQLPEGVMIQRSAFADRRPTLFCVTKYLSHNGRKVTITYDDVP